MALKEQIEQFLSEDIKSLDRTAALRAFNELKFFLNGGEVRAAQRAQDSPTGWVVNDWVKKGILLGFRLGELSVFPASEMVHYFDRNTFPLKRLTLEHHIRLVPNGSGIRDGAFIAKGVIVMPPSYINTGTFIDEGTLIDSHVLVGSCAQVGKRVHLGAATQLGGILEPAGSFPVIVEDDVFVGGGCGLYDGIVVKRRAVLGAGVTLTRSTPVYDLVHHTIYRATAETPIIIPEGAVVVQGSRPVESAWAKSHHLAVATPLIVKYRDEQTDAATALEEALR